MTRHVVIRADAGADIGIGHVTRCATLASALFARGYTPLFVTRRDSASLVSRLALEFDVEAIDALDWDQDASASRAVIASLGATASWIVVDHLQLDDRWERAMRVSGARLLAFDDMRDIRHCVDVVVSDTDVPFPAAGAGCGPRRDLLGPRYALVASAFAPDPRQPAIGRHHVLISYGGSDPTGETEKALAAVALVRDGVDSDLLGDVTVVIGHANTRADQIIADVNALDDVQVAYAPPSLAPYLRACDLFLCAGGQSMIEALAVRRNCLVTITAPNQSLGVKRVANAGLVRALGAHSTVDMHHVERALGSTFKELCRLNEELEHSPFDNLGASRIVEAMMSIETQS